MGWLQIAKQNEAKLYETAVEAVMTYIGLTTAKPKLCCGVQIFSDGSVSVRKFYDYGFPVSVENGINVFKINCDRDKDYIEDAGEGNEAAEKVMKDMPEESRAVMRVFNEKYNDHTKKFILYKNRLFNIMSQMFDVEYEEYRYRKIEEAAKLYIAENGVMEEIFKNAAAADEQQI